MEVGTANQLEDCIKEFIPRTNEKEQLIEFLEYFSIHKENSAIKRGIYLRGGVGVGKTEFVTQTLKSLGYNIISFDAGDVRNKTVFENISHRNLASVNIMGKFHQKSQPTAIVIDEIDGMNSGDKGGLTSLIKLIRPKKTKKQRTENTTANPIICIGNYFVDKKINELLKVCATIEISDPSRDSISSIIDRVIPRVINEDKKKCILDFIQYDLRKLHMVCNLFRDTTETTETLIQHLDALKMHTDSAKNTTKKLMTNRYSMNESVQIVNETDRTIVGLLLHENVADILTKIPRAAGLKMYTQFLDNICYGDYIDRITFQKQIWKFNELSAVIKIFKNARLLHDAFEVEQQTISIPAEIRFTKVLTKYSTEYNNYGFLQDLCQNLNWDLKDVYSYFLWLKNQSQCVQQAAYRRLSECEVEALDIKRIYRYLMKYTMTIPDDDYRLIMTEVDNEDELLLSMGVDVDEDL